MMLRLRDDIELKELEEFGFKDGRFIREKNGQVLYIVIITSTNRYLQIRNCYASSIAGSLQVLIYKLIKANLLEIVEEKI